ncbi:MAG TPA: hypothetical protein DDW65_10015 [Firmicutes bacterium]|nr:hypothetical protein [Bacillota bacterium]
MHHEKAANVPRNSKSKNPGFSKRQVAEILIELPDRFPILSGFTTGNQIIKHLISTIILNA